MYKEAEVQYRKNYIGTIGSGDVGRSFAAVVPGHRAAAYGIVAPIDIGKRMYKQDGSPFVEIENIGQLCERTGLSVDQLVHRNNLLADLDKQDPPPLPTSDTLPELQIDLDDYPSNTDDVIDSRDVVQAIEDLGDLLEEIEEPQEGEKRDWYDDAIERLQELRDLEAEASVYAPDWQYGETLVRDSYFRDYAMELAEDIGVLEGADKWPLTHIDWNAAVAELQIDYAQVEFGGVEYWIRSC